MTWNLHGGVGRDGRHDLHRMLNLVREVDPDILALQEVDSRGLNASEHPVVLFERLLGRPGLRAAAITTADGDYGQALFSRWPLERPVIHDISLDGREPRRLIEVLVPSPLGPLHVLATHLGLSIRERRHQLAKIIDVIGTNAQATTILLGDFNDWMWPGSVQRGLAEILPGRTHLRTFPAKLPLLKLDRIYCHPAKALASAWTLVAGAEYSDHLPLVAELRT